MSENPVSKMFDKIAGRYDIINDLLSFGIHRTWLRKAAKKTTITSPKRILDLATGTGKFAFLLQKYFPQAQIYGIDIAQNMLEIANQRNSNGKVHFLYGDALQIPFEENYFDLVTMSYGIRNVGDIVLCLKEIHRVLKPNGEFIIVEFGSPLPWFQPLYRIYQKLVMKPLGGLISGDFKAYNYLVETINHFPSGKEFTKIVEETNLFEKIEYHLLTYGIAYIYKGKTKKN